MIKDPNSEFNKINQSLFLIGSIIISKIPFIRYLLENLGKSLEIIRVYHSGSIYPKLVSKNISFKREDLWQKALLKLENSEWIGLEFGVAWGYSANFHIKRSRKMIQWHGYDTFVGLPQPWRNYKKGHFTNNGFSPQIKDKRLFWHKGLVEETFKASKLKEINKYKKYIIFDLDLFEPTKHVLEVLTPFLKKGDILYFDEPHDIDEGSLLNVFCKINKSKIAILGCSPVQVLIEIIDNNLSL